MSQVDNVLNTLSVDETAAYAVDTAEEPHIIVGADRRITVPDELRRIAVEHDHNIETVTFDCPRYWDEHDMSEMQVYINYRLPGGKLGSYLAENVSVEGDIMHFTWTISNDVTPTKGNIDFLVCIKKTDSDGNEENHWNSELNQDLYIAEGLETVETVMKQHPDIITQLLTRMTAVENVAVKKEELESVFKIRKTESGSVVQVDDVNPAVEATSAKVKVKSRNVLELISSGFYDSQSGYRVTPIEDGTIVISGEYNYEDWLGYQGIHLVGEAFIKNGGLILKPNTRYTLSIFKDGQSLMDAVTLDVAYEYVNQNNTGDAHERLIHEYGLVYNLPISVSSTPRKVTDIYMTIAEDNDGSLMFCGTYTIQIEEGDKASEFTPPVRDLSAVGITACGENLADIPDTTITKSTNWGSQMIGKVSLPAGKYTAIADYVQEGTITKIALSARNYENEETIYGSTALEKSSGTIMTTFTIPSDQQGVQLYAYSNMTDAVMDSQCTFSNIRIVPGEGYSDYSEYTGASYSLDENGETVISPIAPIMTVYPDTVGAIVEVEYFRDPSAVVEDINTKPDNILTRVEALEQAASPEQIEAAVDEYLDENPVGVIDTDSFVKYIPSVVFKAEDVIIADNMVTLGAGWSGNLTDGFTHASGNTEPLSFAINAVDEGKYIIEYDCSASGDAITLKLGSAENLESVYPTSPYNGGTTNQWGLKCAGDNGVLQVIPISTYTGFIQNLRCYRITDSGETEVTVTLNNVGVGYLPNHIGGFYNFYLSPTSMQKSVNGTRNVAIGYASLRDIISGGRNIGIGTFSLASLIYGENNIGIGADACLNLTTAENMVVMGKGAAAFGAKRTDDIAIGRYALSGSTGDENTSKNVAIGVEAGRDCQSSGNVFIGTSAGARLSNSNNNVIIGNGAGNYKDLLTGWGNTIIGASANTSGNFSQVTVIGQGANATKHKQAVIGGDSTVETVLKGDIIIRDTAGVKRKLIFNEDGTCSWETVTT